VIADFEQLIRNWGETWGLPDLADHVWLSGRMGELAELLSSGPVKGKGNLEIMQIATCPIA
jgi:hypothetical protein